MGSSCFIGTDSWELSGKEIDKLIRNYNMARRKAAEPTYIIMGIDYGVDGNLRRKKVVIGDWNE